jgi:putative intracellular protease/amidase
VAANLNTLGAKKRILIVVANPSVSTTLGWPVGFWASELTHAWYEFTEAGYDCVIASPKGGKVELDALSDPRDPSGYSAHDILSLGFLSSPAQVGLLERTPAIGDVRPADFDALYVAGGQAPMFTFRGDASLHTLIRTFYEAGKVTSAVCHGVAGLLDVRLADGSLLVAGRHMTGFANSEEDFADQVVGRKVMPFRIEDEARKLGANFVAAPAFRSHAVRDGHLITGQQQYSGRAVAEMVIRALGA